MDFDIDSAPCTPTAQPRSPSPLVGTSPSTSPGSKLDVSGEGLERPLPPPSPDKCAICLGNLVNKSYSNSCIHQFCFGCLLEWSKVKPECPLCKAGFRSIFHNIRNNADYDEYVVPTPPTPAHIPSLSIRVSGGSDRSPELLITRGNHDYSLPNYSNYYQRVSRDPRIYRFQLASFGNSRNDPSIDVMYHGLHGHGQSSHHHHHGPPTASSSVFQENPFQDDPPEFFGSALELATRIQNHNPSQRFSGYQSRRRRYDRNQWVRPFDSTLIPGTVFFPSVEYFQRHPSALRRISPWLHRELTVLMSLTSSRSQMAFAYDLVMSLLLRYDIRSSDFRDLTRPYFGPKTRQFQHEFYHYVLSGMRMEEFDTVAQYSSSSTPGQTSSSTGSNSRAVENPYNIPPTVVTLDSDDDEIVIDDVIVASGDPHAASSSNNQTSSSRRSRSSSRHHHSGHSRSTRNRSRRDRDNHAATSSTRLSFTPDDFPEIDITEPIQPLESAEVENAFNEIDIELERLRNVQSNNGSSNGSSSSSHRRGRDPEMPFLEPQMPLVDLNNLSSSASVSAGYPGSQQITVPFRRVRDHDNSRTTPPHLSDFIGSYEADLSHIFDENRPGRGFLDPEDGRRSPYPRGSQDLDLDLFDLTTQREGENRELRIGRPVGSPDFPILTLRENRRNRAQHHPTDHWANSVIGERPSCIHNSAAANSSSVQIRIFPPAMDLSSPLGLNLSSSGRSHHHSSDGRSRPRTPGRPPSPSVEDGECEFLGVHPIIKKPPLAVITLGSEDEGDEQNETPLQQTPIENSTSSDAPTAGTSSNIGTYPLPPKRRYVSVSPTPVMDMDQVQAALSSLPSANLMERHLELMAPFPFRKQATSSSAATKRTHQSHRQESESESEAKDGNAYRKSTTTRGKRKKTVVTVPSELSSSASYRKGKASSSAATSQESRSTRKKTIPGGAKPWDSMLSNSLSFSHSLDSDIDLEESASNDDSDLDYSIHSKKPKKKAKVKKSKKSSKSKSKVKVHKKKKESKPKRKGITFPKLRLIEPVTVPISFSSTSSNQQVLLSDPTPSTSTKRLKSVVVKVDKAKSSKKYKSKEFLSSSSESSDSEETLKPHVRSVIASSTSGSATVTASSSSSMATQSGSSTGSSRQSRSTDIPTPASALDLSTSHTLNSSPFLIERMSMSSRIRNQKQSRRWESDDDEEDQNKSKIHDDDSDSTGSLLSVGKYEEKFVDDDERVPDSDESPNSDYFPPNNRKRLKVNMDDDDDDFLC